MLGVLVLVLATRNCRQWKPHALDGLLGVVAHLDEKLYACRLMFRIRMDKRQRRRPEKSPELSNTGDGDVFGFGGLLSALGTMAAINASVSAAAAESDGLGMQFFGP